MRGSAEDKNIIILSYILLELYLFNSFHNGGFLCHVLVCK